MAFVSSNLPCRKFFFWVALFSLYLHIHTLRHEYIWTILLLTNLKIINHNLLFERVSKKIYIYINYFLLLNFEIIRYSFLCERVLRICQLPYCSFRKIPSIRVTHTTNLAMASSVTSTNHFTTDHGSDTLSHTSVRSKDTKCSRSIRAVNSLTWSQKAC